MIYVHVLLNTICILGILSVSGCSSQIPDGNHSHPACEPRSNTDPGRLNIRANAGNFGAISPCNGSFEMYINQNSQMRSLVFDLEYLNMNDEPVHQEQIRAEFESSSTGIFQTEIAINPVEGKSCRSLQIAIGSIICYSADGDIVVCPEIRIIQTAVFESISIKDKSLNICSEKF